MGNEISAEEEAILSDIDSRLSAFEKERKNLIPILQMIQDRHAYVPPEAIISVTFEPRKFYFIVAVMFFVVTFPLMKFAGLMERKIREKGYAHD